MIEPGYYAVLRESLYQPTASIMSFSYADYTTMKMLLRLHNLSFALLDKVLFYKYLELDVQSTLPGISSIPSAGVRSDPESYFPPCPRALRKKGSSETWYERNFCQNTPRRWSLVSGVSKNQIRLSPPQSQCSG